MTTQTGFVAEGAIAHVAAVRFDARMTTFMIDLKSLPNECFITIGAFVRLDTSMGHFVPLPIRVVSKCFITIPTGVRLLSGVRPHVILQVYLGFERFLTHLALERLVVRM